MFKKYYNNNLSEKKSEIISDFFSEFDHLNMSLCGSCCFKLLGINNREPKDIDVVISNITYDDVLEIFDDFIDSDDDYPTIENNKLSIDYKNHNIDIFIYEELVTPISKTIINNQIIDIDNPFESILAKGRYLLNSNSYRTILKHYTDIEIYNRWAFENKHNVYNELESLNLYLQSVSKTDIKNKENNSIRGFTRRTHVSNLAF